MSHTPYVPLRFLWHPGTRDVFSGYGLAFAPAQLVGLLMVDRPRPVDPQWLEEIEQIFGAYDLAAMTRTGERGILCRMEIAEDSLAHLRLGLAHPLVRELRTALLPLLDHPPAVTLAVAWDQASGCWVSRILKPQSPKFPLGQLVATPGALRALEDAHQHPMDFILRHQAGDWGEVPEEDTAENERSLTRGWRLLSAYRTANHVRIWIITEADRSATTILLPEEY